MPSPGGYFDCGVSSNIDRNWFRATLTHNTNSAPWDTPNAGSYDFEINIGTTAVGPFTPATLTDLVDECDVQAGNRLGPNGVTSTLFGVGGPAALLANTDYWIEVVLHDPADVEVDRFVCGPTHTQAYPSGFQCLSGDVTETTGEISFGANAGTFNLAAPCNQDSVVWELATTPGGPYTAAPSEPIDELSPGHTFTGLTAGTQYYARARFSEQAQTGGEFAVTPECTFTTDAVVQPPTPSSFQPQPCSADGSGDAAPDVEQVLLCDVLPDGSVAGTALAVYEYDETGSPVGAPTFVDPATGLPYVAQGVLQPCPGDVGCAAPQRFCFVSSATVDQPGRMYDLSLDMGIGFAVTGIIKDLTVAPTNVLWALADMTGVQFASDLQGAIGSQFPGATVTVTPGTIDACTGVGTFAIHIECLRLDQTPPTLVQLQYNAGRDLIQNPAFAQTPTIPSGSGFFKRADQASVPPVVSNADVNCTNVANRGWETNDKSNVFEVWGKTTDPGSTAAFYGVTPTPRGTAVQEINAFGSGATPTTGPQAGDPSYGQNPDTIWQTFVVPAAGNFTIRVVVGGRGQLNNIPIKLSTGDVNDTGIGDVINTSVNAGNVDNEGPGQGAWTTFNQTVALAAGTYTLAFTGPNAPTGGGPGGANSFGGLFTDMRVFQDAPGTVSNFANDDDTCTVPVTSSNTTCAFFQPRCVNGEIADWVNVATGEEFTNAAFWAQVPAPQCCETVPSADGSTGGSSTNLVHTYLVCGVTETGTRTLSRVVITDPNGGAISEQFVDTTGALVTPTSWQPGQCPDASGDVVFAGFVCDSVAAVPGTPAVNTTFVTDFDPATDTSDPGVDTSFTLENGVSTSTNDPGTGLLGSSLIMTANSQTTVTLPAAAFNVHYNVSFDQAGEELGNNPNNPTSVTGPATLAGPNVTATGVGNVDVNIPNPAGAFSIQVNAVGDPLLNSITYTLETTPAVPAVPATTTTVKQFRNTNGTSFYENLDGTPHAVTGTIGQCPDLAGLVLDNVCYTPTNGTPGAPPNRWAFDFGLGAQPPVAELDGSFTAVNVVSGQQNVSVSTINGPGPMAQVANGITLAPGHYRMDLGKERLLVEGVMVAGPGVVGGFVPAPLGGTNGPTTPGGFAYAQNVRFIEFDVSGGNVTLGEISYAQVLRGALVECTGCTGGVVLVDSATGVAVSDINLIVDCEHLGDVAVDGQTPEALVLCDITQEPSLDGARTALNLTTLPVGPTAGAFPNGIGFTVDQGSAGGAGTYLINGNSTQTWTFSEPSMLRFGVNNLNVGSECVTLPVGTVVESIHANHTYNALTRVLCNGGAATQTDESIFTLDGATTLAITSNPGGGGLRGLVRLEAAPTTFTEVRTPFLRTICRTCGTASVVTDTTMDAVTPYVPAGTVGVCSSSGDCTDIILGSVCYTPPVGPGGTFTDNWAGSVVTGANGGPQTIVNQDFAGTGIDVTATTTFSSGVFTSGVLINQINLQHNPAAPAHAQIDLGAPRLNVSIRFNDLDSAQAENLANITPAFTSMVVNAGAATATGGNTGVTSTAVDTAVTLTWAGPLQTIDLDYTHTAAGLIGIGDVTFTTVGSAQTVGTASVVQDCETGLVSYIDLATGSVLTAGTFTVVTCPTSADTTDACGTASSIGTICYTPPVAVQTLQDDWTGATSVVGGGSRVWTNNNFANQGITVTETVTPDTGAALLGNAVRNTATSPASQHTVIDLGAPRTNVTIRMDFFGSAQGERLRNVSPAFAAVSGNGTTVLANTGVDAGPAADGTAFLIFPGPVQTISWDYAPTGGGLSGQSFISFNSGNASNSAPAAVLRDCETGATTLVDLGTGTVLNPATISIVDCPDAAGSDIRDSESFILCSSTPAPGTQFVRTRVYDSSGAIAATVDTTLTGAPFVPGVVSVCATTVTPDTDFLSQVLCDTVGSFLQLQRYNSQTGALVSTTNLTLTGAAYVPVGAIGACDTCCPVVLGEGCTNVGSLRYTSLRLANGTISIIDSVTGAAVPPANIVTCPSDDTVLTLTAQARLVIPGTPWTPGADVVGTLTGLTVTGQTGTFTVVDQSGTSVGPLAAGASLTWNVEDDNVLSGPVSVTAAAASSVLVNWTQR